jgi:hypothetical protein
MSSTSEAGRPKGSGRGRPARDGIARSVFAAGVLLTAAWLLALLLLARWLIVTIF